MGEREKSVTLPMAAWSSLLTVLETVTEKQVEEGKKEVVLELQRLQDRINQQLE